MHEPGIDASNIALSVATHRRRLVVLRIDADAKQLRVAERLGILLQLLQHLGKIAAHPRAIIGKWATRIDKGQQQRLAAKMMELDGLAALVDQREVGYFVTRLRNAQRRRAVALDVAALGEGDILQ